MRSSKILYVIFIILLLVTVGETTYYFYLQYSNSTKKNPVSLSPNPQKNPCPDGFIPVPGDPLYKTSDFCVMKYEAKCDSDGDSVGNKMASSSGVGSWNNTLAPCTKDIQHIVSSALGEPIGYIAQNDGTENDAESYCRREKWHLLTNSEYMTIARNLENQRDNWCENSTGGKCGYDPGSYTLISGHSDSLPSVLEASSDDNQGCYGTVEKNVSTPCGKPGTERRIHKLANGVTIWDFAGNMWEITNDTISGNQQPNAWDGKTVRKGWNWSELNLTQNSSTKWYLKDYGTLNYDLIGPANISLNNNQRIGMIFHNSQSAEATPAAIIRGGDWNKTSSAGIFTIAFPIQPDNNKYESVGFRCATNLKVN